ncbi:MAG: rhomboid family intramembrane serine protease [Desulfobacterales bacterium]|jgi:membrane associated rhomboid family serine protease
MIPLRDNIRSQNYPVVNNLLIGLNVLVFAIQLSQGSDWNRFVFTYGLVPARFTDPALSAYFGLPANLFSLLSFMFLHGGFMHIIFNMWSLWIFGDNVEDRLGPLRYLGFYLAAGLLSGLSHMALNLGSQAPTIGASGAVAGVMGAYFILHPGAKILTLIPIIIIPWVIEIPAFVFLGLWFLIQFISAAGSQAGATGIAWWAHIGGFIGGMVLLKLIDRVPTAGLTQKIKSATAKKTSHRLQVVHPTGPPESLDLYDRLPITAFEALSGTSKFVAVPQGFRRRTLRVTVPPGIKEGSTLRLRGLGRTSPTGETGDLYLRIQFVAW